ncbi:hypothetical protein COS18_03075 [Candidatus Falkowbacteria bacterium CG02_land_8_20_14_3_00_36_14]|uniref:Uncharacterized protein n=1 Tax=Candidatus Falkowbacteria bacterium CG02_land_8_20_14_3_00_36_14 TaxID=1974560 RepID=A0A2M7DNB3_9BACT|nr:MAG: hypothetical protein COS18_03075 [Candidatus Falkowbacteria bacterium CG02_land_8_20_14_3_00_36_14]
MEDSVMADKNKNTKQVDQKDNGQKATGAKNTDSKKEEIKKPVMPARLEIKLIGVPGDYLIAIQVVNTIRGPHECKIFLAENISRDEVSIFPEANAPKEGESITPVEKEKSERICEKPTDNYGFLSIKLNKFNERKREIYIRVMGTDLDTKECILLIGPPSPKIKVDLVPGGFMPNLRNAIRQIKLDGFWDKIFGGEAELKPPEPTITTFRDQITGRFGKFSGLFLTSNNTRLAVLTVFTILMCINAVRYGFGESVLFMEGYQYIAPIVEKANDDKVKRAFLKIFWGEKGNPFMSEVKADFEEFEENEYEVEIKKSREERSWLPILLAIISLIFLPIYALISSREEIKLFISLVGDIRRRKKMSAEITSDISLPSPSTSTGEATKSNTFLDEFKKEFYIESIFEAIKLFIIRRR